MCSSLDLYVQRKVAGPDAGQHLLTSLYGSFRPTMLLGLETIDIYRQLARSNNIRQKNELPTTQLRPIAKIQIFCQRVVLPTTRFANTAFSPQAGGAVEIEESASPAPCSLFQYKVTIQ